MTLGLTLTERTCFSFFLCLLEWPNPTANLGDQDLSFKSLCKHRHSPTSEFRMSQRKRHREQLPDVAFHCLQSRSTRGHKFILHVKGYPHRRRIGILLELSKRIATNFNGDLFAQLGENSNSWPELEPSVPPIRLCQPPQKFHPY